MARAQNLQQALRRRYNLSAYSASSDAKIGIDGRFYYLNRSYRILKEIHMVDFNMPTVKDSLWYTFLLKMLYVVTLMPTDISIQRCRKSGIQIIRPDRSKRDDGYYSTDTISTMRVFNGYIYVATRKGIFRHSMSDTSKIGAPGTSARFNSRNFPIYLSYKGIFFFFGWNEDVYWNLFTVSGFDCKCTK